TNAALLLFSIDLLLTWKFPCKSELELFLNLYLMCPQVSGLPGSVFNLAPPHMFGNRLNPNSAMAALIAQSEASPADQEVGDNSSSVGAQGFSIRASPKTTPSPIGGLQIRGETLPPVATSIEQLLERQWNEGQSFLLQQGAQGDGENTKLLKGMGLCIYYILNSSRLMSQVICINCATLEVLLFSSHFVICHTSPVSP
uniref:Uncharacterized protein n=1 Tax=Periophthalmus magnuspinnatus TaxID=409849 RepID=A0A3B4ANX9_9GOBI